MSWRRGEFSEYSSHLLWLSDADAASVYAEAMALMSRSHYGLDPTKVGDIERLDVNTDPPEAASWLAERCCPADQEARLVFGRSDVCAVSAGFFVTHWRDMMLPSRDDVMILPSSGAWVLYYYHEDVFEYGQRRSAKDR